MNEQVSQSRLWNEIRTGAVKGEYAAYTATVEFWSGIEPYRSSRQFVGALDYAYVDGVGDLYLRGWIFSLAGALQELYLLINNSWCPVFGYGLDRRDVLASFPMIAQAGQSGFVFYKRAILAPEKGLELRFRARTTRNQEHFIEGSFAAVQG